MYRRIFRLRSVACSMMRSTSSSSSCTGSISSLNPGSSSSWMWSGYLSGSINGDGVADAGHDISGGNDGCAIRDALLIWIIIRWLYGVVTLLGLLSLMMIGLLMKIESRTWNQFARVRRVWVHDLRRWDNGFRITSHIHSVTWCSLFSHQQNEQ